MTPLKNYKYVFILTVIHGGSGENELEGAMPESGLYADIGSLPGRVTMKTINQAKTHIGRAIYSREAEAFLSYVPIQGK